MIGARAYRPIRRRRRVAAASAAAGFAVVAFVGAGCTSVVGGGDGTPGPSSTAAVGAAPATSAPPSAAVPATAGTAPPNTAPPNVARTGRRFAQALTSRGVPAALIGDDATLAQIAEGICAQAAAGTPDPQIAERLAPVVRFSGAVAEAGGQDGPGRSVTDGSGPESDGPVAAAFISAARATAC